MRNYTLVRSKNRRRSISLQVNASCEIVARAPFLMPKIFVDNFVKKNEKWIVKRLKALEVPRPIAKKYLEEQELKTFVSEVIAKYREILDLYPTKVRFTKVRSYWGSCSPRGVLSFNLSLKYVPKCAVEYVVVHELCHLKYRGHGKQFWDLVNKTYKSANEMRRVLRQTRHEL